jgi:hypothetical protein
MLYPNPQIFRHLRTIFVHVPKCAGSSIESTLAKMCGMEKPGGHTTAMAYRRAFPREFASYFKFTVVRDPLDRFLSAFHYLRKEPIHPAHNNQLAHDCETAEEFALALSTLPQPWGMIHLRQQTDFVCDNAAVILVDAVYRFESIETEWLEICRRLNIPDAPLPVLNSSPRPDVIPSPIVTDFVRTNYAKDYSVFGF